MRTVYSQLRGRIVDTGIVGRRVAKADESRTDSVPPYIEIDETSPADSPERTGWVSRTFDVRIFQARGKTVDSGLPVIVRQLFDRQRIDYFEDDANTVHRRIVTRVQSVQPLDRPEDGLTYHEVSVLVQCSPGAR